MAVVFYCPVVFYCHSQLTSKQLPDGSAFEISVEYEYRAIRQ